MIRHRLFSRNNNTKVKEEIVNFFGFCPPIEYVEHHICHLASAFYSSPFENSTLVSIDGSGDFSTIMIGKGEGSIIEVIESQDFPVSIGILYSAFTQFLGFPYYGDEYKVMGLSPYGKPKFINDLRKIIWIGQKNILEWDKRFFKLDKPLHEYDTHQPKLPNYIATRNLNLFLVKKS